MSRSQRFGYFGSLSFRLALFFAVNQDEKLTMADVAIKFGVPADGDLQKRLQKGVKAGIFARANNRGPGRVSFSAVIQPTTYSAGPRLIQMVGGADHRAEAEATIRLQAEAEAMLAVTGERFAHEISLRTTATSDESA